MIDTNLTRTSKMKFTSPPKKVAQGAKDTGNETEVYDGVTLSGATPKKNGPGLSTLQAVGLGVGLTVAVGGAFVAGVHFSGDAPVIEKEVKNDSPFEGLKRDWQDFKRDMKREGEDFKTEWNRGIEDLQEEPSEQKQLEREFEDAGRELKREVEDAGRDIGRAAKDFWKDLTK